MLLDVWKQESRGVSSSRPESAPYFKPIELPAQSQYVNSILLHCRMKAPTPFYSRVSKRCWVAWSYMSRQLTRPFVVKSINGLIVMVVGNMCCRFVDRSRCLRTAAREAKE